MKDKDESSILTLYASLFWDTKWPQNHPSLNISPHGICVCLFSHFRFHFKTTFLICPSCFHKYWNYLPRLHSLSSFLQSGCCFDSSTQSVFSKGATISLLRKCFWSGILSSHLRWSFCGPWFTWRTHSMLILCAIIISLPLAISFTLLRPKPHSFSTGFQTHRITLYSPLSRSDCYSENTAGRSIFSPPLNRRHDLVNGIFRNMM